MRDVLEIVRGIVGVHVRDVHEIVRGIGRCEYIRVYSLCAGPSESLPPKKDALICIHSSAKSVAYVCTMHEVEFLAVHELEDL